MEEDLRVRLTQPKDLQVIKVSEVLKDRKVLLVRLHNKETKDIKEVKDRVVIKEP